MESGHHQLHEVRVSVTDRYRVTQGITNRCIPMRTNPYLPPPHPQPSPQSPARLEFPIRPANEFPIGANEL